MRWSLPCWLPPPGTVDRVWRTFDPCLVVDRWRLNASKSAPQRRPLSELPKHALLNGIRLFQSDKLGNGTVRPKQNTYLPDTHTATRKEEVPNVHRVSRPTWNGREKALCPSSNTRLQLHMLQIQPVRHMTSTSTTQVTGSARPLCPLSSPRYATGTQKRSWLYLQVCLHVSVG